MKAGEKEQYQLEPLEQRVMLSADGFVDASVLSDALQSADQDPVLIVEESEGSYLSDSSNSFDYSPDPEAGNSLFEDLGDSLIEDVVEPLHAEHTAERGAFKHRSVYVAPYVRIKARRIGPTAEVQPSSLWTPG